jgi:hypothetical protein
VGSAVLELFRKVGERQQGAEAGDQTFLRYRQPGAEAAVRVLAAEQPAEGLGEGKLVRLVLVANPGREGGVVGRGRQVALLQAGQQAGNALRLGRRRRPREDAAAGRLDVDDFRVQRPLLRRIRGA